jgi:hypothetical protein
VHLLADVQASNSMLCAVDRICSCLHTSESSSNTAHHITPYWVHHTPIAARRCRLFHLPLVPRDGAGKL